MIKIGPYSFREFVDRAKEFHGFPAPGVILGGMMVDAAVKHLPPGILYNAICETEKCLPDAIQLLTPCTIGNGWLRVQRLGRFALALFDKDKGKGIRAVLSPEKMEDWPEIENWYYKLKPKEESDLPVLLNSIRQGGYTLINLREIQVQPALLVKKKRGERIICPQCREPYPSNGKGFCLACQGESPYVNTASDF
ncbi:MAG: formylmethanofuran dehydrogenase subunit E family protein [Pseudomonadota bacterium]